MTSRELRNQRREAERKARKLEYQQNRLAAAQAREPGSLAGASESREEPRSGPTGPRTPHGKAVSSGNSLKHGLASGRIIIPGEDPAELEALLSDLVNEHAPANETESLLIQQMAQSWWLMQRAIRLQNEAFTDACVDTHKLALFLRYQTTHERAFYKALNTLTKLKLNRARGVPSTSTSAPHQAASSRCKPHPEFVSQTSVPATPLASSVVPELSPAGPQPTQAMHPRPSLIAAS